MPHHFHGALQDSQLPGQFPPPSCIRDTSLSRQVSESDSNTGLCLSAPGSARIPRPSSVVSSFCKSVSAEDFSTLLRTLSTSSTEPLQRIVTAAEYLHGCRPGACRLHPDSSGSRRVPEWKDAPFLEPPSHCRGAQLSAFYSSGLLRMLLFVLSCSPSAKFLTYRALALLGCYA